MKKILWILLISAAIKAHLYSEDIITWTWNASEIFQSPLTFDSKNDRVIQTEAMLAAPMPGENNSALVYTTLVENVKSILIVEIIEILKINPDHNSEVAIIKIKDVIRGNVLLKNNQITVTLPYTMGPLISNTSPPCPNVYAVGWECMLMFPDIIINKPMKIGLGYHKGP